jgi:hypothetical protein
MKRSLVLALAVLLLAGCASRAASTPPQGKPTSGIAAGPNAGTGGVGRLIAKPKVKFTPMAPAGSVTVGRAHRVNVRNLPPAPVRHGPINCSPSGATTNNVRVTPSPATSQVRICLPVGGTLTLTPPTTAYHWSRPLLVGSSVLRAIGHPAEGAPASYRATGRGAVQLSSTGSPPGGSLAAQYLWTARVVVR